MRYHQLNTHQKNSLPEVEPATVAQILDAYARRNLDTLLGVLGQRPNEFARQLNRICRAFPGDIERITAAFGDAGRALPVATLVRLHNQYANAARGVGENIALNNSRMAQLIQAPAITRQHAAELLLAVEMCLSGRMRGMSVSMPAEDLHQPMEAEPTAPSCNPALDGAINPFTPGMWEPFPLCGLYGAAPILCASGVRQVPDGYELEVLLLDNDYNHVATVAREGTSTCFTSFWDEEGEDSDNDVRSGTALGYHIEEYAELDIHRAMVHEVRYVVVSARVGEQFPNLFAGDEATDRVQNPHFDSRVAPDIRALTFTPSGGIRPVAHRGNFHVLNTPSRTVCAVVDLYKQRINTCAVTITSDANELATLTAIMSALGGYLPMSVREYLNLAGAKVQVTH